MKFSTLIFLTLFLSISDISYAQTEGSSDIDEIQATIQNYLDGWMTGDSSLVSKAMHSTCNLKFIRDGKLIRMDKQRYISGFKPKPKMSNTEGRITSLNITRNAAAAKIEIVTPRRHFTDYFNLLKEGGRWYITDKVSTSISRE